MIGILKISCSEVYRSFDEIYLGGRYFAIKKVSQGHRISCHIYYPYI